MSSPEGADRPALLAIEHPLSYTKAPFVGLKPKTDEERVKYLYEHKLIEDLMHEYSYSIDACKYHSTYVTQGTFYFIFFILTLIRRRGQTTKLPAP